MKGNGHHIVIAGGKGFLGQLLTAHFLKAGFGIVVLTRSPKEGKDGVREVGWDTTTLGTWAQDVDGASAIINVVGRSVDCRYNARNRRLIMESRVNSTRILGQAIAMCKTPPPVWLNASTATIYKHTFGPAWNEDGEIGATPEAHDEFSIEVATAWERALNEARTPATRRVAMRSAMVLGLGKNSVFPVMRRLTRFGLGGRMGSGRQFVSWIHQMDFCRAVEWLLAHKELNSPVNICAPHPVSNAEWMKTFRTVCGVPLGLPAAEWMLEVGAFIVRTESELLIKSRRVAPGKLMESGFAFRFSVPHEALMDLEGRHEKSNPLKLL
jgi:uncharacterized protein (TIGR01777 family)